MKKLFFIFGVISMVSCTKEKKPTSFEPNDYLIFGDFYGMCAGDRCVDIYKLGDAALYEDVNAHYPYSTELYDGEFTHQLSTQQYNATKDIIDFFPDGLLNETDTVIGSPDAGDWGGYYVEYNFNGVRKFWLMDKMKANVSSDYHTFIDKMEEKLQLLEP